jgi:Fe-Mn family superoxide dismutase
MSEPLIVSHYENNYGGAVKRLNLIEEKLAELDYASVPVFVMNGLKREQLIAVSSMILHELFFDGLGDQSEPGVTHCDMPIWLRVFACWHRIGRG